MDTAWRLEPGGYLRHILNARVYDIAVSAPLLAGCPCNTLLCNGFRVSMRQIWHTLPPVCAVVRIHCSLTEEAPEYLHIHPLQSCVTPLHFKQRLWKRRLRRRLRLPRR